MIKSKTSTGSPPIKTPTDVTTNNLINMYKRPVTTATSKTVIDFYKNQKWSNPTSKTTIPTTTKKTYNPSSSLNTLYEAEKTIREQAKTKTTYKLPETTPEENMFSSLQTFLDDKKGSTTLEIMERPKTKPVKTKMELDVTHEVDYRGIVNQRGKLTSKRTVRTRTAMEAEARDTAAFKRYLNERAAKMTEARQRAPKLKTGTAVLPFTIGASIQRDRTDAFNIDDTTQDTGQDSVQDNEAAVKQITNTLTGTKQGSKQTTDQVSDSMTKVGAAMMMGGMPRTRITDRLPVLRLPGGSGGSGRSYGPKIGNIRNVYANQISGFDPFEMRAKRRRHK
jgi:hypothetical protein